MIELEQEDPIPQGDLALQITAFHVKPTVSAISSAAGWSRRWTSPARPWPARRGRACRHRGDDRMAFLVPVAVGAQLSFYPGPGNRPQLDPDVVEVWSDDRCPAMAQGHRAVFVFVAIDGSGRTRSVPSRAR